MQDLGLVPGDHHTEKVVLEASMIDLGVSKRSIPIMGGLEDNDDDIDPAFNYQAMEEGLMTDRKSGRANDDEQTAKEIVALEPVVDKEGKIEAIQVSSVLDAASVERLIRQIVLPCGLAKLEHPNAVPITDKQLTAIEDYLTDHQRQMHAQLTDLREKKSRAHSLFRAASVNTSQTTNYGVKEATALTDCDKECDQLLSSFVAILVQITALTDGLPDAQWAHQRTKWLWDSYQQGMQKIFNKSLQHENKLLQLANRPGVVPQMFMNAAHRSSFFEVVKEKYYVLDAFYVAFFSTLQDETENPSGPTFLRRLMTNQPFVNGTILEFNSWFNLTALDTMCARLVETFCELIQVVRSGQLSEVQKVQEQRCARLFEVVEQTANVLCEESASTAFDNADRSRLDELRIEGNRLISHYKTFLPRPEPADDSQFNSDFNAEGTIELAAMRQQLVLLVANMISLWRCLRWIRSQTSEAPAMPLRLLTLMNKGEVEPHAPSACHGGGGKRRFASVLASLLYQSLIVHCNEWHAELTQAELLESMGQFDGAVEVKVSNKKRKKQKASPAALPLISEKLDDAKSVDSSDSDALFDVTIPAPAKQVDKRDTMDIESTSQLPHRAVNGVSKAGVEETKEGFTDDAHVRDLREEKEPELTVSSKRGRRSAKADNRSIAVVVSSVVDPDAGDVTQAFATTNSPKDVPSSKKPRDRRRKPSPPKEGLDKANPLLVIDPVESKNPEGSSKQPPPAPEVANGKTKASKDSPKQRRPLPTIGSPTSASTDVSSRTSKGSTRQSKTTLAHDKDPTKLKRLSSSKEEGSPTQSKATPPIEVIDSKDVSKQRKSSLPKETSDAKTHMHKETRRQRKPSPPKVTADRSSPDLKEPKSHATLPKEIGNSKSKDAGKKGQKKALKDNQSTASLQIKIEGGDSAADKVLKTSMELVLTQGRTTEVTTDEIDSKKENVVRRINEQDGKERKSVKRPSDFKKPSRDCEEGDSTATVEKVVSIGVEDSSGGVELVEDFLVSRLCAILDAGSKDANGNPIVFL